MIAADRRVAARSMSARDVSRWGRYQLTCSGVLVVKIFSQCVFVSKLTFILKVWERMQRQDPPAYRHRGYRATSRCPGPSPGIGMTTPGYRPTSATQRVRDGYRRARRHAKDMVL